VLFDIVNPVQPRPPPPTPHGFFYGGYLRGEAMTSKLAKNPFFQKGASLNDGTDGFRFNFGSRSGLYRVRKATSRFGLSKGQTTRGLHFGKRSVYLERKKTDRSFWNFSAL
jgi:hypothetical protein